MRPSLGSADDRAALWEHIETTVDCIASDHAPHTLEEKLGADPPPGVPGLETLLPLLLSSVASERLSLDRLVQLLNVNPSRIYGLPPTCGEAEVEIGPKWVLPERGYLSRCDWSPFGSMHVRGRVLCTTVGGKPVYAEGQVLARPGSGRVLVS
jgi:carbamoyl-phosphate synthase/aspartate carbamoyltransferase/dihydroorotase